MTVPPKWRQRLADVRATMPAVEGKNGTPASGADRARVERELAHSTVPPEHLGYVRTIRQTRAARVNDASYLPEERAIEVPTPAGQSFRRDTLRARAYFGGSLIHEYGHAVDHNLNPAEFNKRSGRGSKGFAGRREAVAENYADRHTARYGTERKYSTYDQAVAVHEARKAQGGQGNPTVNRLFGAQGITTYKDFRKLGLTPDDPVPPEAEVDRRLAQNWTPDIDHRWGDPVGVAERAEKKEASRRLIG